MPNLFYRLSFGLIGRATLGEGLIHHIGDLPQPRIGVRTLGKSRIKTRFVWFGDGQFIIHLTALFIQWLNLYNSKISSTPVLFLPITRKHTLRTLTGLAMSLPRTRIARRQRFCQTGPGYEMFCHRRVGIHWRESRA